MYTADKRESGQHMNHLARFVVRLPLLVVAVWIVVVVGVALITPGGPEVHSAAPHPTEAVRADALLSAAFPSLTANNTQVSVVATVPAGQTIGVGDQRQLGVLVDWLRVWAGPRSVFPTRTAPIVQSVVGPIVSHDRRAALVTVTFAFSWWCYECDVAIQAHLNALHVAPATTVDLTGAPLVGQAQDQAFAPLTQGGLTPTLVATVLFVLLILGSIYRSPLAVLVPLGSIGLAVFTALNLVKLLSVHGWVPHGPITNEFVSVVLFGAGTNYCIFLLSRYREILRDGVPPREAIVLALTRVGESIASSAATVIAAMAVLGFANSTLLRYIGPAVAVAVALMLVMGVTLVPALMRLSGRAFLWPATPRVRGVADETVRRRRWPHVWAWLGALVVRRPAQVLAVCFLLLLPLAGLALTLSPSYDDLRTLPPANPAVRGAMAMQQHFNALTDHEVVVVVSPVVNLHALTAGLVGVAMGRLTTSLRSLPNVLSIGAPVLSPDGHLASIGLVLSVETSSPAAHALIDRMRQSLAQARLHTGVSGMQTLVTGDSAYTRDEAAQVADDFRLILWAVSAIIFVILAALVRSLSAPFYLLLTIALSTASSIGLTILVYHIGLGQPVYYTTPIFAFVFLVALGEDFNILLMSRVREEMRRSGLRAGVARAVSSTGGTLSSCGIIMAGTFSTLMSFDLSIVEQIGFAVAAGVLMDTFIIRPLLVPAVVCLLGRWNWVTWRGVAPRSVLDAAA